MASPSRTRPVDTLELDGYEFGGGDSDHDQSKPVRACQACRASKVRCLQPDDSQPCMRCKKGNRLCLPTENPNKRQKRYDGRSIVELESTLAALTSSLSTRNRGASDWTHEAIVATMTPVASHPATAANAGLKGSEEAMSSSTASLRNSNLCSGAPSASTYPSSASHSASQIEAIIGEIVDGDTACAVFEKFTTNMLPEFPFVTFPQNTSGRDVWESTPITFLAILDVAASGFCGLEASRRLRKLLLQIYANYLLETSQFSLPLLQALIISAAWHRVIEPTQPGEHIDVYQISHAAANMAIIMGLGKSLKAQTWNGPMPTQFRRHRGPASKYQASSLDARRIWLACHYICSNTSMALQTPNIMRWTRYMDECLEVLDMSPASLASDKVLCLHVRLQHIVEDFELQLSSSPMGPVAVGVTHRASMRQLATWAFAPRVWNDPLRFSQHFVELYMHEIVMHPTTSTHNFPGSSSGNAATIDPADFTDCLVAAHGLFDVFLSLEISLIRALPTFYFVRLTYATIVLVKLHFAASRLANPSDAAHKARSLKVDDYIGRMLQKVSGWGTLWPAWRLTKVFRRVREWFRLNSSREMMASSELAWLNVWAFKEEALINENADRLANAELARGMQSFEDAQNQQQDLDAPPTIERIEGAATPVPQTLPTPSGSDPAWDPLRTTDPGDMNLLYGGVHDPLHSLDIGDSSMPPYNDTQLDMWLDTNVNTSTFDFDGDLQSMIQYMD